MFYIKNISIIILLFSSIVSNAQKTIIHSTKEAKFCKTKQIVHTQAKSLKDDSGEILWYDDFSNPANWTMTALLGNENWHIAPSNSPDALELNQHMANDVIWSGNVAFFNAIQYLLSPPNPFPAIIEATLTLNNPIDLSDNYNAVISWSQKYRAYNYDKVFLEYSYNKTDWFQYGGKELYEDLLVQSYAASYPKYNLSAEIGGQSSVYLRFRFLSDASAISNPATYGAGYGWMIDDITITESAENDIVLEKSFIDFFGTNDGYYNKIPLNIACKSIIGFRAAVLNFGANNQTGVKLQTSVANHFLDVIYNEVGPSKNIISTERDTLQLGIDIYTDPENPVWTSSALVDISHLGNYLIDLNVSSDVADESPNNNEMFSFEVTENLYARDNGFETGSVSPAAWSGGGVDGDLLAVSYTLTSKIIISGMKVFIASNSVAGSSILGKLIIFNNEIGFVDILVSNQHIVTSEETGSWVILEFPQDDSLKNIGPENGEDFMQCLAGVEITYNGHTESGDMFRIGEDVITQNSPFATIWKFASDSGYYYLNYSGTPMINLMLEPLVNNDPLLHISPAELSGFIYKHNFGPSESQSYYLSGINLSTYTDIIEISTFANYEISLDDSIFYPYINIQYTGTSLNETQIYVRLKGSLPSGTYNSEYISNYNYGSLLMLYCNGNVESESSISETNGAKSIKLFPNPSKGIIYFNELENANISVFNLLGEQVMSFVKVNKSINISSLPKGIYILKVTNKNIIRSQKITLIE